MIATAIALRYLPQPDWHETSRGGAMLGRTVVALISILATAQSSPARAAALKFSVDIDAGPLSTSLRSLQDQTGIELLYDGDIVRELRSPSVAGRLTTEAALQQMLSEADLTVRRTSSGAWIIERRTTAPLERQDAAVSEILVIGRRTQNADIRRDENDVQPYVIATQEEILRSHRDDVDQFIASRITSNTSTVPSLASQDARVMSSINLRGLTSRDTVVLVDGRRMPSIPDIDAGFAQTDVNAIPLHAIERIEVLTGSTGGIHGFGALGGVVNIVIDRDVDGLEFFTTQGVSSRGDSRRHSAEMRFGQSFNDGATSIMLHGSHQALRSMREKDRGFVLRDYRRMHELAPELVPLVYLHGDSLTITGFFGDDLTFKPEYGGGTLGAGFTYLPIGFSGDATELPAALRQHAGQTDLSLPSDQGQYTLGSNPQTNSLFANVLHAFGENVEAYADAVLLRNRGEAEGPYTVGVDGGTRLPWLSTGSAFIFPESPANPFTDILSVYYLVPGLNGFARSRIDSSRYTAGVKRSLSSDWRATVEASWGRLRYSRNMQGATSPLGMSLLLLGDESDLETNPFGDWDAFERAITSSIRRSSLRESTETRFDNLSLRLAGPVFRTAVGDTTLTLLAERRSERVPPSKDVLMVEQDGESTVYEFTDDPLARRTRSLYGELRSRVFDESVRMPLVRGLELQLAVRRDEQEDDFQRTAVLPDSGVLHSQFSAVAYTAGLKISPWRWLTLRSSYSTGEQPPPHANLVEMDALSVGPLVTDPKRGDTDVDPDAELQLGGNSELKTARASTMFAGVIITPRGLDGPRFAVDYSRIRRTRDVRSNFIQYILEFEDQWPDRVRRAALTDEDMANGFTAGAIEMIDVRDTNDGMFDADVFDLSAEWPLNFIDGQLRLYVDATYQKSNVRSTQYSPGLEWAGYRQGPLKRRANGGFDWTRNRLTIGANAQYFSSILIFDRGSVPDLFDDLDELLQGSTRIPSQTYLDLYANWRLPVRNFFSMEDMTLDAGFINVFDKAPPREGIALTSFGPGYSRYGDARRRRFEVGISFRF
jgi:outer membrane receptor protein involved in Fe transport